jgi:hypothetical protein
LFGQLVGQLLNRLCLMGNDFFELCNAVRLFGHGTSSPQPANVMPSEKRK